MCFDKLFGDETVMWILVLIIVWLACCGKDCEDDCKKDCKKECKKDC